MRLLFVIFLLMITTMVFAQKATPKPQQENKSSSSLEPYYPKETKVPKKAMKKKSSKGATYESQDEYVDRMTRVVKEKRKAEKEMMKPQYSNPLYFGHKRPPKKNKAGKLKFCKECGIRH